MQTHTILIILGAVSLLAGVMGGGLTLKEMKLPSLDNFSRGLAGIVGIVFIAAGIYLERDSRTAPAEKQDTQAQEEIARKQAKADAEAKAKVEDEAKAKARADAEAKAKADLARQREEERRTAAQRQKERDEADFTKRALAAPKNNAWIGEFRIYDPASNSELAGGQVSFGPTTQGEHIAYARLQVERSTLRQLPRGTLEATQAVWGFMGSSPDSAVSLLFGNAADTPILVFNKLTKDTENGYLELRGVLFLNKAGKNEVVAHTSASCRAR